MSESYPDSSDITIRRSLSEAEPSKVTNLNNLLGQALKDRVPRNPNYPRYQHFNDKSRLLKRIFYNSRSVSHTPEQPSNWVSDSLPSISLLEQTNVIEERSSIFRPFTRRIISTNYVLEYYRNWSEQLTAGRVGVKFYLNPNMDILAIGDPTTFNELGLDVNDPVDVMAQLVQSLQVTGAG